MEQAQIIPMEREKERERMITIAGGVEITVKHVDGSSETVKVRQIPATKLEAFMTRLADEANSISIYCDKPLEWVDTLTHQSINDICEKGLEINEPFLVAWCRRRAKWMEMMNVGVIADLQRKVATLSEVLDSVNSARKSPTTTTSPQTR